jgi:hypothetical protein
VADIENGTPEQEPADDLRSMLSNAVEEAEAPAETERPSKPERARGPDGKFVAKEGAEEPAESTQPAEAAQPVEGEAPAEEQQEEPATPATEPPGHWKAEDKEMFKKAPAEMQAWALRREKEITADYTRKTQAIAELKREYEPVDQMFAPFKAQMHAQGWTPSSLIKAWADVEQRLMRGDGVNVVSDIVRQYKIDPSQLVRSLGIQAAAPQQGQEGQPPDPVLANIESRLAQMVTPLQERINSLTQDLTNRQRAEMLHAQRAAEQQVEAFINATAENGEPLHPHYAEVENDMVALAQIERANGRVPDLQTLYDRAVWANPSTRAAQIAAQQTAAAKKAQDEARAKAAAAKKAASSVTGAPSAGQAPKEKSAETKSLRELIEDATADALA